VVTTTSVTVALQTYTAGIITNSTNTIDADTIHALSTTTTTTTITTIHDNDDMISNTTNNNTNTNGIHNTGITTNIILQHHYI